MTEKEWLATVFPDGLLAYLSGRASDRKLRLFGCACCRMAQHMLKDTRCGQAVHVAEEYADGLTSKRNLEEALHEARQVAESGQGAGIKEAAYAVVAALHESAMQAARVPWW